MTQRILAWSAIGMLGLLGSTKALALESGFYIGAVGAQATADYTLRDVFGRDVDRASFTGKLDDSDTAVGLVLGGQFGRWVAIETQIIDLGEYSSSGAYTITNAYPTAPRNLDERYSETVTAAAVTLSGIFTIPLGEQFAIGLRGGFAVTAADTEYEFVQRRGTFIVYQDADSNDAEASDLTGTFGVSVEWDPVRHFGMRLEWQRINDVGSEDDDYDVGDELDDEVEHSGHDVDLISLNLIGRF